MARHVRQLVVLMFLLGSLWPAAGASAHTRSAHRLQPSATVRVREPAQRHRPRVPLLHTPRLPGLTLGLSGAEVDLSSGDGASIATWDRRARRVGARLIRLSVNWAQIAPANPGPSFNAANPNASGYDWAGLDQQVRDLAHAGFTTLIEVGSAPTWAEGPDAPSSASPGSWEPNAADFGAFATALARRYDGHTPDPTAPGRYLPRVRFWQAWNEPNLSIYLAPQWVQGTSGQEIPESPLIYRQLNNAFYRGVTSVSRANFVIGAGTAPYGDPPGGPRMRPVTFDQNLFCLNARNQRIRSCGPAVELDAVDDHPYVSGLCCLGPTWHATVAGDTSIPDVYEIADVLHAAERARTVAPGGPKALWATELGWTTNPPNPVQSSPVAQVASWAAQALYILWSQGVNTVMWFQLSDQPESSLGWGYTLTEGLYYVGGAPKPTAAAFAFPFITNRHSATRITAWGRAPAAGMLYLQRQIRDRWVSIARLRVRAGQVFEAPLSLAGPGRFRAVVAHRISPAWSQGP